MIWKDIKGWKGQYQVNRKGQVKSLSCKRRCAHRSGTVFYRTVKEILLRPYLSNQGYYYYFLYSRVREKTQHIARCRLIGIYFIPNPKNKKEINHKNCNRTDDRIGNLEWATRKENSDHSIKNSHYNICKPGELNPAAKLTDKDIMSIRKDNRVHRIIAVDYNVSRSAIGLVKRKQRWGHIK